MKEMIFKPLNATKTKPLGLNLAVVCLLWKPITSKLAQEFLCTFMQSPISLKQNFIFTVCKLTITLVLECIINLETVPNDLNISFKMLKLNF